MEVVVTEAYFGVIEDLALYVEMNARSGSRGAWAVGEVAHLAADHFEHALGHV